MIEINNKLKGKINSSSSIKGSGISPKGETGNGIEKIEKTNTEGLIDTYTIYYTDGTTSNFQVLNGEKGTKGDSAYQIAVKNSFEGTEEAWLASLKGDKGDTGDVLPVGGTKGQVLTKNSETDGDASWKDSAGGDNLPVGTIVDYDGDTVPDGYEEVEDTVEQALQNKVDKVEGKTLSTNDFTNEYKNKIDGIQAGATNLAKIILDDSTCQGSVSIDTSNYNKGIFIFSFKADKTSEHSCHIMSFRRASSTASNSIQLAYSTANSTNVNTSVTYSSTDNKFTFKNGTWGGILTVFYIGV